MNSLRVSSLASALLALATLLPAPPARAERPIDATVITEQTPTGASRPPGAATTALPCVLLDGGFIEAGDPVAGEKPPTPEAVRGVLQAALSAAGFTPGTASPALLLTYHWGVIRHNSHAPRRPFDIDPNYRARVALVASAPVVSRAEDYYHAGRKGYIDPSVRDALTLGTDGRYFLIVSAYDYADARQSRATLLWRVRLSAMDNSGYMNEVIPALAASVGPYLNRSAAAPDHPSVPRAFTPASAPVVILPSDVPADFLNGLILQEHDDFAGLLSPAKRVAEASH